MSIIEFDANDVAIDVAYNLLPVWWMEVYPFRVNQSKSLLHVKLNDFSILTRLSLESLAADPKSASLM